MGKHTAHPAQCDAVCTKEDARRFGFIEGSRCTGTAGHPVIRNGGGHFYPKRGRRKL